ncbi:ABC transporter permease [Neomicrococcus lactis]|uniref:Transport permease protein n=1 Tax=Neomicrococcus lactis TaxID=732241 RepID=A0A7W8Y9M3_9MICC|nr:ABC transporter permease [Neomicrococcus lactis]MBB5597495.1 teichoic acid transport system permease protein [Neomicrococcus lactis]
MTEQQSQPSEFNQVHLDLSGMRHLYHRPRLGDYISQMWRARTLAFSEARASVLLKNQRSYLGGVWLVLNPILNGLVYFAVFGLVLRVGSRVENYLGFLFIGMFMFQMTSGTITQSADSIFSLRRVITSLSLPVAMAPSINTLRRWLDGLPSYLVMVLLVLLIPPMETLSWKALFIIPLIALQFVLSLGMAYVAAYVVSRVHDFTNILTVGIRGWMFASGVMFPVTDISNLHPTLGVLVHWNPLHHVLEIARSVLLYDTFPSWGSWEILGIWAIGTLVLGLFLIWRREGKYDFNDV